MGCSHSKEEQLVECARSGDFAKIDELIGKGTSVDSADKNKQCTALHVAAETNNVALIKLLMKHKCNINALDYYGWTPFHYAVNWLSYDAAKLLLDNNCTKEKAAGTPVFHLALPIAIKWDKNPTQIIQLLLANNFDVNDVDNVKNHTALMRAVLCENPDIAALLIPHMTPASIETRDHKGRNALYFTINNVTTYDGYFRRN